MVPLAFGRYMDALCVSSSRVYHVSAPQCEFTSSFTIGIAQRLMQSLEGYSRECNCNE